MKKRYFNPWRSPWVSLMLLLPILLWVTPVQAADLDQPVATTTIEGDGYSVVVPDWDHISFSSLPPVLTSGDIGPDWNHLVGYDLSRTWNAGDAVSEVIKLGDIAEGLAPEQFSLNQISHVSGWETPPEAIALSEFALAGDQSLLELVTAVPTLAELQIQDVVPIHDLLESAGYLDMGEEQIGSFVTNNEIAEDLKLGQLGTLGTDLPFGPGWDEVANLDLTQYSLADIPGLSDAPLEHFARWENQFPSDIPGLVDVAFSKMPNGISAASGAIARIDTVMGTAEAHYQRTVSGSTEAGFSVPCDSRNPDTEACAHIELDDIENVGGTVRLPFEGRAWISGTYQKVKGGHGALGALFGGKEPTGRHPFSNAFKVIISETDETTDTVETQLYFRVCRRWLGCSPYGIGPVPFLTFSRDDYIFLGKANYGGGSNNSSANGANNAHSNNAHRQAALDTPQDDPTAYSQTIYPSPDVSTDPVPTSDNERADNPNRSNHFNNRTSQSAAQPTSPHRSEQDYAAYGVTPVACTGEEVQGINLDRVADAIAALLNPSGTYTDVSRQYGSFVTLGRYQYPSNSALIVNRISRLPNGTQWLNQLERGYVPPAREIATYFPKAAQDKAFKQDMRQYIELAKQETDPQTAQPFIGGRLIERITQMWLGGASAGIDAHSAGPSNQSLYKQGIQAKEYYYANGGRSDCFIGTSTNNSTQNSTQTSQRTFSHPAPNSTLRHSFGLSPDAFTGEPVFNTGVHLEADYGHTVQAIGDGLVTRIVSACPTLNRPDCPYGNWVELNHGDGLWSFYAQLSEVWVNVGDTVEDGQQLGKIANEGLYFELSQGGPQHLIDPASFIDFS